MKTVRRALLATLVACLVAPGAASAASCLNLGIYQDDPVRTLASFSKSVPKVNTLSTYLTGGRLLDPRLIKLANAHKKQLLVSWAPDRGSDGPNQRQFRLSLIAKGKYDLSLKALGAQFKQVKRGVVFRPMYEPNTPWYAWSGTVNGNTPENYVAAWKRVRATVKAAAGAKVKFMWAPYARSVPDSGQNAISKYFPGLPQVDFVGASAFNFGTVGGLSWTEPIGLFSTAYSTIQALVPKPFWLAETGSTATGGDKAAWISSLASLRQTMPRLAGVVWFDAKDTSGDFRLTGKPVVSAFKALAKGVGCK
jgi:hypothetical protein